MKYQVKILETYATIVDVDADSEQEAQAFASDLLAAGCYADGTAIPEATYDSTVERDEWPVWEGA